MKNLDSEFRSNILFKILYSDVFDLDGHLRHKIVKSFNFVHMIMICHQRKTLRSKSNVFKVLLFQYFFEPCM
jgi:hypothetical protein